MDIWKSGQLFNVYVMRRHSNSIWCINRNDKLQHRASILLSIICFISLWRWPSWMKNFLITYPSAFCKPFLGWAWKENDTRSSYGLEAFTEFSLAVLSVTWGTLGLLKCCCVCMCTLEMGTPSKTTMKPKQCPYCSFLTEDPFSCRGWKQSTAIILCHVNLRWIFLPCLLKEIVEEWPLSLLLQPSHWEAPKLRILLLKMILGGEIFSFGVTLQIS